jgi:hypothetical protein
MTNRSPWRFTDRLRIAQREGAASAALLLPNGTGLAAWHLIHCDHYVGSFNDSRGPLRRGAMLRSDQMRKQSDIFPRCVRHANPVGIAISNRHGRNDQAIVSTDIVTKMVVPVRIELTTSPFITLTLARPPRSGV